MKKPATKAFVIIAVVAPIVFFTAVPSGSPLKQASTWQRFASPGALSAAHATLENDCATCHTPVKGIETAKCVVCHANNEHLLGRQPTSFHASIGSCRECHLEHRGRERRPTDMDHTALAEIGLRQLKADATGDAEFAAAYARIRALIQNEPPPTRNASSGPRLSSAEGVLNCAACHLNQDIHRTLFGNDCAACHATQMWTIPEFRHPSSRSRDCAQCHQAPPSHYMKHFNMISATIARKPHARVNQCFECHRTTSWNDIPGRGWYKHH